MCSPTLVHLTSEKTLEVLIKPGAACSFCNFQPDQLIYYILARGHYSSPGSLTFSTISRHYMCLSGLPTDLQVSSERVGMFCIYSGFL
jgi:hypothetical protein